CILALCLINPVVAQVSNPSDGQKLAPNITAFASNERVRFTAPSSVVEIRLEAYSSTGRKLFDNEVRGGNVLDWLLKDGQGAPLADDNYLCVVTVKELSGRLSQKIGFVTFENKTASMHTAVASQINPQQAEAIGPVEENASLTILTEGESQTATIISHNGIEGQITRGRGALSFRIGDFYSGKDTEQMRLTAEGNLGIGITHPQAKLDVDGLIRASQGIIFPDGTVQYSASSKTLGAKSARSALNSGEGKEGAQAEIPEATTTSFIPKFLN